MSSREKISCMFILKSTQIPDCLSILCTWAIPSPTTIKHCYSLRKVERVCTGEYQVQLVGAVQVDNGEIDSELLY